MSFSCATWIRDRQQGTVLRTDPGYRHEIEVTLQADFPMKPPELQWKTDIFHPNIADGHPVHPRSPLGSAAVSGGCMLPVDRNGGVQNYDANHALQGAQPAAEWVRRQPADSFPADPRTVNLP